uniref:Sugar phosphate transporter domain-containing protein n=2 Tax=Tetraselmis sp. GSL018 TaxID=582737 RepID=A0A061S237_9CHLO|eukprot:CAMPEP_0177603398 /NCGR_PEP_ID=MMETSP0419_2-20121207/15486_1 /TAXON_ID=582737 /ORGANISM="Tetraselmis sp., Strain GSL018" /LENGTH=429 /DNA_ID=CAMNT_0019097157 /DNA_START=27 /DNA_END=1316 /DNA_ORIENTATION=-
MTEYRENEDGSLSEPLLAQNPLSVWPFSKTWRVALSVCIYWLSVSLVPVYNKRIFSKTVYPYPVATAAIQLGMVSAALGVISLLKHLILDRPYKAISKEEFEGADVEAEAASVHGINGTAHNGNGEPCVGPAQRETSYVPSWILGRHYLFKIWAIAPVGLLFGLKYGVTNWGLHLVPTGVHLLLQATDLLWTVLAAYYINGERQGPIEATACLGTVFGSVLIGLRLNQSMSAALMPLVVNLLSPILLGLCIATLRRATVLLMTSEGPLRGTMTSVELTCHKLYLSALSALACAVLIEGIDIFDTLGDRPPFWAALSRNPDVLLGLAGGAMIVLIFQVNITWLSSLTTATAVGIVGGVKIVPQWLINLLFELHVDVNPLNLAGAAMVMISAVLWTHSKAKKVGLKWMRRPREEPHVSVEDTDLLTPLANQ